jgi:uncharacterized membrane protein YphA (DoxX/SURF4 family)
MTIRKILTAFCRIFVGVLFIISGLIKANDPTGFGYKLTEYWEVFHIPFLTPASVYLAMLICIIEIFLGVNVLLGAFKRFTLIMLIMMIVFFSFLTFYSAWFHKVTDCGCFGDAVHLTPWQSFSKDLILLVLIAVLWINRRFITPVFPKVLRYGIAIGSIALSLFFTMYCFIFLPVKDFLPYAKGKDIVKQMTIPPGSPRDSVAMMFIYTKGGKEYNFTTDQLSKVDSTYTYKDRKDEVIRKGYEPPIHDFVVYDLDGHDLTREFLYQPGYRLVIVQQDLEKASLGGQKKVNELVKELMMNNNIKIWALTSSSTAIINNYKIAYDVPYTYFTADNTQLKSMIRSNPGLLLLKDNFVIDKWPGTGCPTVEEVMAEVK